MYETSDFCFLDAHKLDNMRAAYHSTESRRREATLQSIWKTQLAFDLPYKYILGTLYPLINSDKFRSVPLIRSAELLRLAQKCGKARPTIPIANHDHEADVPQAAIAGEFWYDNIVGGWHSLSYLKLGAFGPIWARGWPATRWTGSKQPESIPGLGQISLPRIPRKTELSRLVIIFANSTHQNHEVKARYE